MSKLTLNPTTRFIARDRLIKIDGREYAFHATPRAAQPPEADIKNPEAAALRASGRATEKQATKPIKIPRVAKKFRRAENEKLRALESAARGKYNAEKLLDIEPDNFKARVELSAEYALKAILPTRGAIFRELMNIRRAMKSAAAKRGALFNSARFSAIIKERRAALFSARVGSLIAHRIEYGSPRKKIARLTRAAAKRKISLVKLQIADRENVIQNVIGAIIKQGYDESHLFNREKPNLKAWKILYSAARAAIRPLVLTHKGADGISREYDAQSVTMEKNKSFSTMVAACHTEDKKRAALVRFLIRAAIDAKNKEQGNGARKFKANFKSALSKIRAIATRAGSADIINSQSNDAQARAAALAMASEVFRKYILSGAGWKSLELKSFRDIPAL
jgi:hypothetical protein